MATLRKRGERWQVQVRRKGSPSLTRSFLLRSDAQAWAREQELEADLEVSLRLTRVSVASLWPTSWLALAGAGIGEQGRQSRLVFGAKSWLF